MALSTGESEFISITKGATHGLKVPSAMMASAGRAVATRRGAVRVHHLVAGLFWLHQLCAEGVVEMRTRPGKHNEEDLGTKMVNLRRVTSLLPQTPLRPAVGWS